MVKSISYLNSCRVTGSTSANSYVARVLLTALVLQTTFSTDSIDVSRLESDGHFQSTTPARFQVHYINMCPKIEDEAPCQGPEGF
jgi:hypothetical protein